VSTPQASAPRPGQFLTSSTAAPPAVGSTPAQASPRPAVRIEPGGPAGSAGAPRRARGPRRPPRLASLQLKRIDPWTVLKISLIVAIVMFFVWMIAVGVLYLSLGSMDVWTKLNSTWNTLTSADAGGNPTPLVTPRAIFSVTAVIGAINIVLFTALATIAAFVYNAAAGMSGGVEVTLGERD